ncbi:MAG: M23 family metallopeptidase [Clostridia bacterium]|nr:M23 family metallopeptidase [Clostridia bacterium]
MKRTQIILIVTIVVSIFLLSFLIGRATALKDNDEAQQKMSIYKGAVTVPKKESPKKEEKQELPAAAQPPRVEKKPFLETEKKAETKEKDKKVQVSKKDPLSDMIFPCGKEIVNEYSTSVKYSKTMGDWRVHSGVDFGALEKTDVLSVWDGNVDKVYKDNLWGYCVEILNSENVVSVYKNLDKDIKVNQGQIVSKGQVIGKVGRSAAVEINEKPHLHFELIVNGVNVNPMQYLK